MKNRLNTDEILRLTILSLGGTSEYVSKNTRWINFKLQNLTFSTYSMRMPIDSPLTICKADNKLLSRLILKKNNLPIIEWSFAHSVKDLKIKNNNDVKYVIKPIAGMKGLLVITGIKYKELRKLLKEFDNSLSLFVEPYIESNIYKVLLLNHKIIGIYEKFAPYIVGDGVSNVGTLIDNFKQEYFDEQNRNLNKDYDIEYCLKYQNINAEDVLKLDHRIKLTNVINISRGAAWKSLPITFFSDHIKAILEKATKVLNLKLAGIDLIQKNSEIYILEVNPSPGLLGHTLINDNSIFKRYNFTIPQKILSTVIKYLDKEIIIKPPIFIELPYKECLKKLNNFKQKKSL